MLPAVRAVQEVCSIYCATANAVQVIVAETDLDSPAREAGLRARDRIVRVGGASVTAQRENDLPAIRRTLGLLPKGEEASLEVVRGDETLVELVLQNLLTNAGKYSPAGTEIEVSLQVNGDGLPEVQVRDQGIGLDSVDLENLFTPFYRSDRARDVAKGLGLGLTVCMRALEAQGGGISASAAPGAGSIFRFYLQPAD